MLSRRTLLSAAPGFALTGLASTGLASTGLALTGLALTGLASAQQPAPEILETNLLLDAWTDTYGRPNAKVTLNGEGPFRFMVDTGSTNSVIVQRVATLLAAPIVGSARVIGTTGAANMPLARIARLETGVVTKRDINVSVLPGPGLAGLDGILGADVFIGKKLSFDIQAKEVKVETSRHRMGPGNLRLRDGILAEVDGLVGDIRVPMMLDTGAQFCIVNPPLKRRLERRYPNLRRVNRVRVMGVVGPPIMGDYFELPKTFFSKFVVSNAGAVAADAQIFKTWELEREPAMIVGASLLSRLSSFSIDYGALEFDGKLMAALVAEGAAGMG